MRRSLALLAMVSLALSACSSSSRSFAGATVAIEERDFKIQPATEVIPAGPVRFRVKNVGPSTHEMIVARTDLEAGALPLQEDGLTVHEDSDGLPTVGSIEGLPFRDRGDLRLKLEPGHYVLFCNLEGHYLGGMHASIQVG